MAAIGGIINRVLFPEKLDPCVKASIDYKNIKHVSVIIQFIEEINDRVKKGIIKRGGIIKTIYPFINACHATVPPDRIKSLEAMYPISFISLDYPVTSHLSTVTNVLGATVAHNLNYSGKNITIALLDTGTYPHPDIIRPRNRIIRFADLVNRCEFAYDDNGHGTFMAGILVGNGSMSKGEYTGIAPEAYLISIKVLNQTGTGRVSTVLAGLQWIYDNKDRYRIKVVCIPLGCTGHLPWTRDPLACAVQVLWDEGLVVCASAGNNGPAASSISSPGINPNIITAGAVRSYGNDGLLSEPLCGFSSRGSTRDGNQGPDVVAPGSNITSLECDTAFIPRSQAAYKGAKLSQYYRCGSGTSAACASIAGIVSLMLDKNQQLSPDEIKSLLKYSCKSLNLLKVQQGWGLPDLNRILGV